MEAASSEWGHRRTRRCRVRVAGDVTVCRLMQAPRQDVPVDTSSHTQARLLPQILGDPSSMADPTSRDRVAGATYELCAVGRAGSRQMGKGLSWSWHKQGHRQPVVCVADGQSPCRHCGRPHTCPSAQPRLQAGSLRGSWWRKTELASRRGQLCELEGAAVAPQPPPQAGRTARTGPSDAPPPMGQAELDSKRTKAGVTD